MTVSGVITSISPVAPPLDEPAFLATLTDIYSPFMVTLAFCGVKKVTWRSFLQPGSHVSSTPNLYHQYSLLQKIVVTAEHNPNQNKPNLILSPRYKRKPLSIHQMLLFSSNCFPPRNKSSPPLHAHEPETHHRL